MAHELSQVSGRVEFFSTRLEWHRLGTVVDQAQTADDAIRLAGLDWAVHQRSLHLPNGLVIPNRVANVRLGREGEDIYLGTVGRRYEILQNRQAFSFMDSLVGRGRAVFETAGALRNGGRIFLTAKLPGDIVVGPSDDRTEKYLLLVNGHDGVMTCRALFTPVRTVCANTLAMALRSQTSGVSIRHSGNIERRLEEAERVLSKAIQHYDQLAMLFGRWREVELTRAEAREFFRKVVPPAADTAGKKTRNRIGRTHSELMTSFERGPGADMAGRTLWGAYNALTHWVDHVAFQHRPSASVETRMENIVWGAGADLKQRAFSLAKAALN